MKSPTKAQSRKAQIVKAAANVFAEKGYDYATIEEIAKQAGFSDSTVYKYFTNKQILLGQVIIEFSRQVETTVKEHLRLITGAGNQIRGILGSYARAFEHDPVFARACRMCIHQYQMLQGGSEQGPFEKLRRLFESTLKKGIASGEFDSRIDVTVATDVLTGAVNHIVLDWLYRERKYDLLIAVDSILDTVFLGVVPPAVSASPRNKQTHNLRAIQTISQ